MSQTVYTDLASLILLYQNGDLPEGELAFPYYSAPGKVSWAHVDELKRQVALGAAYPQANTQKGKK
jgi:hypothetical protein